MKFPTISLLSSMRRAAICRAAHWKLWNSKNTGAAKDQGVLAASQLVIAQAVENRLAIANGQVAVQAADGNIYWRNWGYV